MCWVQAAAGCSPGDTVPPVCRKQDPPREPLLPGSGQEPGAVQSCTIGISHQPWYPSRGKPSAQQCTPSAGQGLTNHSPGAGQSWGTGLISPTDSEMEKGDSLQLHHPPGSLPILPPGEKEDVGTIPHLTVPLQLQLAALCPGDCSTPGLAWLHCRAWHRAASEGGSRSGGEFCEGQR